MPVILPRERYADWLSADTSPDDREALLVPYPAEGMKTRALSTLVNSPRDDAPEVLK
jgi:putative SOS response-associated peptidase YedK